MTEEQDPNAEPIEGQETLADDDGSEGETLVDPADPAVEASEAADEED